MSPSFPKLSTLALIFQLIKFLEGAHFAFLLFHFQFSFGME